MSLNTIIRKAVPGEIDTLADIAFIAWERDLKPFLNGAAASGNAEKARLTAALRDGLDRVIVAEVNEVAAGWCQRMRGRAYIPFLFVTPLLQNQGVGSALLRRMESILELEGHDRIQAVTELRREHLLDRVLLHVLAAHRAEADALARHVGRTGIGRHD